MVFAFFTCNSWAPRLSDPDDPRTVEPWSFAVQDIVYQLGDDDKSVFPVLIGEAYTDQRQMAG